MGEKLSAGIVAVALVAPLCTVCIVGPAFLASTIAGISGWFVGLSPVLTTGLAIIVAIFVYGLLRKKKLRIDRTTARTANSSMPGERSDASVV